MKVHTLPSQVYNELTTVLGKEGCPHLEDQPNLPYTSAVVLETQRLASVLPLLYPHEATCDTKLKGRPSPINHKTP